jgi:hypothetical protein
MIRFLLTVLVCATDADCRWERLHSYRNEAACQQVGLINVARDPRIRRYKCTVLVESPDSWGLPDD